MKPQCASPSALGWSRVGQRVPDVAKTVSLREPTGGTWGPRACTWADPRLGGDQLLSAMAAWAGAWCGVQSIPEGEPGSPGETGAET